MPTHVDIHAIKKGEILVANYDAVTPNRNFRRLGASGESALEVSSEDLERVSGESGIGELLAKDTIDVRRSFTIPIYDASIENVNLWFGGVIATHVQAAATVTDDDQSPAAADAYYYLGKPSDGPGGVRTASAVTVKSKEGAAASAWVAATAYVVGDVVVPTVANDHWYMATTAGTSDASEPTFPTDGSTVVDSGVTWQDMGVITYVKDTDYEEVDLTLGQIYTKPTGALATAVALAAALTDAAGAAVTFGLRFGYDIPDKTWYEITDSGTVSTTLTILIQSKNPRGPDQDYYFKKVECSPTGSFRMKSPESAYLEFELECVILKPDDGSSPFTIIDRAA